MDKRRRFQIALGGIASCLLIAALFVSSAPPLTYPAVSRPVRIGTAPLLRELPAVLPQVDLPAAAPSEARRLTRALRPPLRSHTVAHYAAAATVTTSPLPVQSETLRPRTQRISLTTPPDTRASAVDVPSIDPVDAPDPSAGRGPVTGAFVTAGKEVGRGFRTAGRAIRSIF
jgi:hypothetical protein